MTCPLCGSAGGETLYKLPEGHTTRRCKACALVFLSPRPTEDYLNAYYSAAPVYCYESDVAADYDNAIRDKVALIRGFLERFPLLLHSGPAVDFGAGQGATVKALSMVGFDAVGVEISEKARAAAEALFDVPMQAGGLEDFAPASLSFVSLFDVLEHMLEPGVFLRSARCRLKKGGGFLAVVPNFNSLDRLMRGVESKALIFPEHVNQFTGMTLRRIFEGNGFRVLYLGSPPPYGVAISFGWRRGVLKLFGRSGFSLGLNRCLTWLKKALIYPLPNAFVEKTGLLGQSLLILAIKARD
jgi:SAM-dependent methyltransferase